MAREPPLNAPPSSIEVSLANPELGAKQICPTCSTKFYDLGRRPAVCPKCAAEFDPEEAMRNRRVRARTVVPEDTEDEAVVKPAESEDGFEAEPDDAPELDAAVDDPPMLSDDDASDPDMATAPTADGLGVDFAEDEDLAAADDDDDVPFIEDDDDAFPSDEIGGLAGGPAEDH